MVYSSTLQGKIYFVRVLLCLSALGLLAVNDTLCDGAPGAWAHPWLLVAGLLYPHLGHLLFGRFDVSRRRGHLLFMADGLFAGSIIAALEFAQLPGLVLLVINLFNWMVVGGPILLMFGCALMYMGMLTAGPGPNISSLLAGGTCPSSDGLAIFIATGYFLIVAGIIHRLVVKLRLQQVEFQARSDSASSAQAMAEQALLAVLPPSAASRMADTGDYPPEQIQTATVLVLQFVCAAPHKPVLGDLKEALPACSAMLERHGIELLKTFGPRVIAFSRKTSGPDDAFKAYQEIDTYFGNHDCPSESDCPPLALRAVLHTGSATLGLVQPERLNLDLLGDVISELDSLMSESAGLGKPCLVISASAARKLGKSSELVPLNPDRPDTSSYLLATGSLS